MNKEYITISDINRIIKFTIESNSVLKNVYIKGEISNLKFHSRGHLYFSLKDENSKINAVMFNYKSVLKFIPKDGDSVLVHGRVSVYEATGSYQIYVDSMVLVTYIYYLKNLRRSYLVKDYLIKAIRRRLKEYHVK